MGGPQYVKALDTRRQRHGALYHRACAFCRFNDFHRGFVYQPIVKRFQTNTDFLALHA
jgi:hypothetical protein